MNILVKVCFSLSCALLTAQFTAHPAAINAPTPHLKPAAPHTSILLSQRDQANFRKGIRAADTDKWPEVRQHIRRIQNPIAKKILKWRIAVDDPYVSLNELSEVVHQQGDWPSMTRIRAKAEALLFDRPLSASQTINWFGTSDPVSGEGRGALARAYYKRGEMSTGDTWLRLAWRESRLSRDRQKRLFKQYGKRLTREDHAARADHLIWQGRHYYGSASGLLSLMGKSDRALMDARMRVAANRSGMDAAIKAVPASRRTDAGLLFERAHWRRKRRTEKYALPVYLDIKTPPVSEKGRKRVWRDKKYMASWALKNKRYQDAYDLCLHHGFERGLEFAEAEFMAGWIALTKLNRPRVAAGHFKKLKEGVSRPVSKGRASYWQGRAAEEMNDPMANVYYAESARYPNVYYSLLASEKLDPDQAMITLPQEVDAQFIAAQFEMKEQVQALRMLGEIQNERMLNRFSFHLDDILTDTKELSLLAALAKDFGYMKPSVRAAKQAARLDTMLTESGYPKPEIITNLPNYFDIPFVLAIARQESEFNTKAASGARAYGMMQMINATARSTARSAKLPYRKSWLTGDPEYATKLGSRHLNDLLRKFDGSYIMAAAAYNAGPHRVRQWNKTYGDPRKGEIDPIDWVESIPFSETR
ncbi:MAG TPA: lytic transglycosylase domain-containing protein, partial [Hellea balneolensis]|nr:lytic transglycosylase domain-containing protein [Hellea balneolensis]